MCRRALPPPAASAALVALQQAHALSVCRIAHVTRRFLPVACHPSPARHQGYEVLYLTDVIDEYVMGHLTEYEDLKLANISKEDLKVWAPAGRPQGAGGVDRRPA